jgi:lipopolysaccharide/colanic/teichoic acid biosynthesis glycosyltransferase
MVKRLFDMVVSAVALAVVSPVILLAALGVRLSSRGPVFYRAARVGRGGAPFTMHKLRTMHVDQGPSPSVITGPDDRRVFVLGRLLRLLKIDELPQFWDVLRGEMSLVGPRPEDPSIVRDHYAPEHLETLRVRPGLTSPGSLYGYTRGDRDLAGGDPERAYVEKLLPIKLALEAVYVRESNFGYDLWILVRTALVILLIAGGRRQFRDPPELRKVSRVVPARVPESPDAPRGRFERPVGQGAAAAVSNETEIRPARLGAQPVPTAG